MSEIQRRAEHTTQHRVRMSCENGGIHNESSVVYDEGNSVFASQNVQTTLQLRGILIGRLQGRA